jgi:hypothetical protein
MMDYTLQTPAAAAAAAATAGVYTLQTPAAAVAAAAAACGSRGMQPVCSQ